MTTADRVARLAAIRSDAANGTARRRREAAKLSRSEMAAGVGVSVSTIYRWEAGERSPRGEPALRWGDLLDRLPGSAR